MFNLQLADKEILALNATFTELSSRTICRQCRKTVNKQILQVGINRACVVANLWLRCSERMPRTKRRNPNGLLKLYG